MKKDYLKDEELNIGEVISLIWKKKIMIILITLLVTCASVFYLYKKKQQIKTYYTGSVAILIGEINRNDKYNLTEWPYDLKYLLDTNNNFNVQSNIPSNTRKIIELSSQAINEEDAINNIKQAYEYILLRENQLAKNYKNYIKSRKIGDIVVSKTTTTLPSYMRMLVPISFLIGCLFGIFIVIIIENIQKIKREMNEKI